MSPIELSPATSLAVPSSTLWAQPSREWVIPAKPKPGRKPKKEANVDPVALKDYVDENPSSSRRVQNRAAQRAFRERKQTQLAELQTRLHSYEQGEVERNVALQSIAKKMKEENEELRKENQTLRETVTQLERERDELLDKDKKRAYDNSVVSSPSVPPPDSSVRKRARVTEDKEEAHPLIPLSTFPPSSHSPAPSPDPTALVDALSTGECESHSQQTIFSMPPPINDILSFMTTNEGHGSVGLDTCILCRPDAPCVCKEITVAQPANTSFHQQTTASQPQPGYLDSSPTANMSILDNLPAFQAPVPIRRRTGTLRTNPVFPVTPMSTISSASKCSGDPDNCMACADDNFGKAFCQAIGHTMDSTLPCIDCPKRANQADKILVGGCCGDVSKCGSCGIAPVISSTTPRRGHETIPTDDAWRQLKSHPNVAFADLTLLAEVVARRSKCTGSRVVLSPAPGSVTPDHNVQHFDHEPIPASEEQSVLLTDPHDHLHQKQKQRESPPQLVPQHVLIECGRQKVREVNADGVREALRLLDQKFAHMR